MVLYKVYENDFMYDGYTNLFLGEINVKYYTSKILAQNDLENRDNDDCDMEQIITEDED